MVLVLVPFTGLVMDLPAKTYGEINWGKHRQVFTNSAYPSTAVTWPLKEFFVMSPNELLNNSTSSTRTRMIQEDPGNHKWPLGLFGRAYRVKSNIVSRGLTFYVQCLVTSIYRVYILNCCIFVYMPRSKSPFQNATVCTILSWVLQMAWSPLQSGLCQYCGTLGPGEKHRGSCYLWGRAVCRRAVTWMKCDEMLDIWRWIWEIDSDRFVQCNIL